MRSRSHNLPSANGGDCAHHPKSKRRASGVSGVAADACAPVAVCLTTTPNPLVATINHERMPVLLTREEEFYTWLRGSAEEAFSLAGEYPAEQMRIVQEGFDKEDLLKAA